MGVGRDLKLIGRTGLATSTQYLKVVDSSSSPM
jgi:hypothetical protein